MNIRRGFFRLWVVFSALFIIAVFAFSLDSIYTEFKNAYFFKVPEGSILLVPTDCNSARGKKATYENFVDAEDFLNGKVSKDADYSINKSDPWCWYDLPKFRSLYPEYKDLSDNDLYDQLYKKAGIDNHKLHPWQSLLNSICTALGIPLLIFALGWGLLWAGTGFSSKKST
jgi:hypothetical protein